LGGPNSKRKRGEGRGGEGKVWEGKVEEGKRRGGEGKGKERAMSPPVFGGSLRLCPPQKKNQIPGYATAFKIDTGLLVRRYTRPTNRRNWK